jgi:hypothetical protein
MIPDGLAGIDAEFLTGLMQERCPGVRVVDAAIEGEIHGTATKARLRLVYGPGPRGPDTLYVKGGWEGGSEILRQVGIFAREPRAYAELLPSLSIAAPRHFGAIWSDDMLDGVLLLEDLGAAGAKIRTPESDIATDEANLALLQLARMHGSSFGEDRLPQGAWIRDLFADAGRTGSYLNHILQDKQLEGFLALPRGERIPARLRDPGAIRHAFAQTLDFARADTDHMLLHGDAHVGNSYVDQTGKPAFLDWQCVSRGGWAYDVAYYTVSALGLEERRKQEEHLLLDYIGCLAASGGPKLMLRQAMAHYRAYLCYGFLVWLANSTSFQPESYNAIVAARFAEAMIDHGMA